MSDSLKHGFQLPPEQQAIRDKCFHPSGTFVEFPIEDVETSIPARFERIAQRYPEYIAIKIDKRVMSYAELNRMANRLARVILTQGGKAGKPVALLFEKGVEQFAAMIGVLKTGRAFVLLDCSLPKSRIEMMLEDCPPDLMITDRQNISLANDLMREGSPVIEIESIDTNDPIGNLYIEIPADALAFIVHTSGSTGRPKGVIYNHNMLLHHVMLRTNADGYCPMDRIPHVSSGTANAITNVFFAFLNGAALLPFDVNKEGSRCLSRWLSQERITVCPIAAPLFRNLCESLTEAERFPDLRLLRLRSETVCKSDVDLYKRYFAAYSVLANGLSSSETHMLTQYYIDRDTKILCDDVPVGYAAPDKEILLLDDQGNPVGFNKIGEIVVRSKYLSPGYWCNPELTAVKFQADPEHSEKRIYFTGDLGLMLPDGCLIHKGRKDFRVKIRGYGVEVGEVEKVLRNHSDIRDVVVVTKMLESGEARLVAYFTSHSRPAPNISELRRFLNEKLPDYMIPSDFVALESFPLTSNGKIDRKSLPTPGKSRPELDTLFEEPRTLIEKELAQTWSEILSLQEIGVNDNFFDLGGHSLAAMRVVSQVIKKFQFEMPLQSLFAAPTVAEMAAVIEAHQGKKVGEADLASMLAELESLSEDEARRLIAEESGKPSRGDQRD